MRRLLRRLAMAAGLGLGLAWAAQAQPASTALEDYTWPELRAAVASGKTTILVPIGGTEQNGPHMTLGKHNARARVLAGRIAAELGDALVAPVIAYVPEGPIDPPTGHMRFPGTISIPKDAFEKTLEGAARSFQRHGFRDVVFLGDHGGYRASLRAVAQRLNREWRASGTRVHALDEYYVEMDHAGRDDTALMLAADPRQVRLERLAAPSRSEGVAGDPRGASVDSGQPILENIVRRSVDSIKKARSRR